MSNEISPQAKTEVIT